MQRLALQEQARMRQQFRTLRRVLAFAFVGGLGTASALYAQYPQYSGFAAQQQPNHQYRQAPPAYSMAAIPQVQTVPVQQTVAPLYAPPAGYQQAAPAGAMQPRLAMAQATPPQPSELPLPTEPVVPAAPQATPASPYPSTGYGASGDCNCNSGASSWNGYMNGACDSGCNDCYGVGNYCAPVRSRQWFFGAYALYMDRDNPGRVRLTQSVDNPPSYPYYPPADRTIMFSNDAETDWQWGAEIRFGSTFGCAQTCGCQSYQPFAWEVGYWGLVEEDSEFTVWDELADTDRYYGMVNYAGLMYDRDGAGATYAPTPVNSYYDYQMPIEDPSLPTTNAVRVLAQRVRTSFSAQNLEVNFIRFPICSYGSCGGYGCNDCCSGCYSCGPAMPRFSINGLCGFRYVRLDDDFNYYSFFTNYPTVPGDPQAYPGGFVTNSLIHDISVDNELAGFQLGSSMCWCITSRWSAFCDTTFGIYNNHIQHYQRLYGVNGIDATWAANGEAFSVRSSKDDLAFLGEARLGLGYQVSCNWRLTAAYRFLGIGGVASTVGQIPTNFANYENVAYIDSNEALILHGVQFGAEMKY
jgi:hypothetical protein